MADSTLNPNEPHEIKLDPIQPATPQPVATPAPTPVVPVEVAQVQPTPAPTPVVPVEVAQPQPAPVPVATPEPIIPAASSLMAESMPQTQASSAESVMDKVMKFKLYIIIFASVIGLATVGYVTYSFFFSGTSTTETTPPPSVSSPFGDTTTTTDTTNTPSTTTNPTTTPATESTPPSLGGNSSTSQTSEFGKTVQDLKDVSTGTDKVYDNAVLEETTPSTMEVIKKIPR